MEANRRHNIKTGQEYAHLFPKAEGSTSTIRKNADVTHTVAFIPKVVSETLHHTTAISKQLKGSTTYETCSNIWHFVYGHIAYKKDQEGYEQIRSPARAWHDRKNGVDCDCYSVFISSILTNLNIPHILRITKYHRDYFQHIYPVVVLNEKEIPIDCVTDRFDYEVPYSEKKDYPMDLQYLNGFDSEMGELGKLFGKKKAKTTSPTTTVNLPAPAATTKKKKGLFSKLKTKAVSKAQKVASNPGVPKPKKGIKKILNKVNKINPATVLLRNGILAAMKLNVKNIAKRLRWSYLTPEQAAAKGVDPQKFQRLVATRQKLESIFYGAGGNEKNLKKAILEGKGNSDKAISGISGFTISGIEYMSAYTPLPQLLGRDVYYSENIDGFEGLGQLGEPVTLASVGAAMGVLAGIVAALKQIGDIFPKKTKGSEDFDEKANEAAENNVPVPGTTPVPASEASTASSLPPSSATAENGFITNNNPESSSSETYTPSTATNPLVATDSSVIPYEESGNLPAAIDAESGTGVAAPSPPKESFWEKNKGWLRPVAFGVGGISLIAIGFAALKPKPTSGKTSNHSLSGIPKKRKKKQNHRKRKSNKSKPHKKTAVALL